MLDNTVTVNYWADWAEYTCYAFDQVDNLHQDQISFRGGRPDRKRLGNKAEDVLVNTIPAARSDMRPHNLQRGIFCHVTTSCPQNVVHDHGKVYDVTHHASNILLAEMQETEQAAGDTLGIHSPASICIVNPIRELVSGYIPVTIGNSIH